MPSARGTSPRLHPDFHQLKFPKALSESDRNVVACNLKKIIIPETIALVPEVPDEIPRRF